VAEYVMHPEDNPVEVVRALLDRVDDPQAVMWSPRPDVPGGGVYVVRDEETVAEVSRLQQAKRDEQAKAIADAQAAADARDAKADETGLTPAELAIPASTGTDPGAPGTEGVQATPEAASRGDGLLAPEITANPDGTVSTDGEESDPDTGESEPVADDPTTPEDESKMTPAQRRAAKRKAAAEAAATEQANADSAAQEETK
jgi:hypothetical protein